MGAKAIRVRLFNAKFSPNLGDGLSCECLERALIERGCDAAGTYSVDLAARTSYRAGSALRGTLLQALHATPAVLRRNLLRLPLAIGLYGKWLPHYRRHLASADAVVVGGGNLLSDIDLNFPTKLAAAIGAAADRQLPVFLYGIGVGATWSAAGSRLLRDTLRRARAEYVGARDEASKQNFDQRFSEAAGRAAEVVRDPGLLISRYVAPAPSSAASRSVGVCITSGVAIRYHSACSIDDEQLLQWYAATLEALRRDGHGIRIFTNGSPEDVDFARRLLARIGTQGHASAPVLRPGHPNELAGIVSSCSLVVAFRMHALIAAYSYGVAIIALRWDEKVQAFMKSVGLEAALVSPGQTSPQALADLAGRLLADGASARRREAVLDEAMRDVRKLAAALLAGRG